MARKSTIKKKIKKNKEKTSVKYIALPATLPSGLNKQNMKYKNTKHIKIRQLEVS